MAFYEVVWKWLHFDVTISVRTSFSKLGGENIKDVQKLQIEVFYIKLNKRYRHTTNMLSWSIVEEQFLQQKMVWTYFYSMTNIKFIHPKMWLNLIKNTFNSLYVRYRTLCSLSLVSWIFSGRAEVNMTTCRFIIYCFLSKELDLSVFASWPGTLQFMFSCSHANSKMLFWALTNDMPGTTMI